MKVKEFNELKKQVKAGKVGGLKEVIGDLTLSQAKAIEDMMLDLTLNEEMNKVLDEVVNRIDTLANKEKKVANKKQAPQKQSKTEKVKTKKEKTKKEKPFNKVKVGDIIQFQVEGEEVKHDILIVYKGVNNIVAIMAEDEREVFLIRKTDFNKGIFNWKDRHGEEYNIIVTLK